ncbi:MAG: UvrD-helicase domain-containing protein [Bacilli bacterium]
MKWTDEQLDAINRSGSNIIVSAGAGSGKTSVLTERVITKLKSGIFLNELLILTFTNNSAHDMQEKIKEAINKYPELDHNLNKIDCSFISTFDAYVFSLVKKYHYYLNIDKNIEIIDSSVINFKKKEIIADIFTSKYLDKDKDFINLVTNLCAKNDYEIQNIILNLDKNLDLIIEKEDYLNNYLENYYNNIDSIFNQYLKLIKKRIEALKNTLYKLSYEINPRFYDILCNLLKPILEANNYDTIQAIGSIKFPSLPPGSSDNAKFYKAELKKITDEIILYSKETKADLIKEVLSTKNYSKVIIDILLDLNNKINKYKRKHNCFEFSDISRLAITLLKEQPDIAEKIKYHFKEIMIDEYQDTNDIQDTFINLIENNNVYMVGDIKQSIYRFRNANPRIFKEKYDSYKNKKKGQKIDLNKNFRSRKEVIETINSIFNKVMDDEIGSANYALEHQMVFGNQSYNIPSPSDYSTEVYTYEKNRKYSNEEIEAYIIAKDIKSKIQNKFQVMEKGTLKDCTYQDFCILIDRTSAFDVYKNVFEDMQIPLNIQKDENILFNDETFLIKNILTLTLKIKNKEFDSMFRFCFTSIARSYLFAFSDEEFFLILNSKDIFNNEIFKLCQSLALNIDYMSNKEMLEKIIFKFDFYMKMIAVGNIYERNLVLNNLLEKAEELNKLGINVYGLEDYLDTLLTDKSEIKVPPSITSGDAIIITNVHKSKGLEYHICYFSGLYKRFNLRDPIKKIIFTKDFGFILPAQSNGLKKTFIYALYIEKYIQEEISEKIRLFYVSLTRCKEKIIMIYPSSETKEEQSNLNIVDYLTRISYRSFLDILVSVNNINQENIINLGDTLELEQYQKISKKDFVYDNTYEKIEVNELELSFKKLTKKTFSKNTVKLLSKSERENISYGNKIHYILESLDFLNPDFTNLTNEEKNLIEGFLNQDIMKNIKNAKIVKEYEFQNIENNNHQFGVIDLLLIYDQHIDIIDYKLKNISDNAYISQLQGYRSYIEKKTNKKTYTYLYSILDQKLVKID